MNLFFFVGLCNYTNTYVCPCEYINFIGQSYPAVNMKESIVSQRNPIEFLEYKSFYKKMKEG